MDLSVHLIGVCFFAIRFQIFQIKSFDFFFFLLVTTKYLQQRWYEKKTCSTNCSSIWPMLKRRRSVVPTKMQIRWIGRYSSWTRRDPASGSRSVQWPNRFHQDRTTLSPSQSHPHEMDDRVFWPRNV